jgi:hypothetical protein
MNSFVARIGTFFFVIGFGLFVLFLASDMAKTPQFDYLCLATLSISIGWMLARRRAPPASAGRFSLLRRTRENMRKRRQEPGKENKSEESGER